MQTIWPKNEKRSTLFHLSFTHFLGDSTHSTKNQILSTQSVTILSTKNVLSRHLLTNTTITTKLVGISYFSEEPSHRQISFDAISQALIVYACFGKQQPVIFFLSSRAYYFGKSCIENSGHICRTKSHLFNVSPERTSHQLQITFRPLLCHYGHKSEKSTTLDLTSKWACGETKNKTKGINFNLF